MIPRGTGSRGLDDEDVSVRAATQDARRIKQTSRQAADASEGVATDAQAAAAAIKTSAAAAAAATEKERWDER